MKLFRFFLFVLLFPQIIFALDPELPRYQPKKIELSKLSSIGSDSMEGLMREWVTAYRTFQPKAKVQVVSSGSASAPPALVDGIADLGPMAREMKTYERESFMQSLGFEPTELKTAIAAIAVYVSDSNPIEELSFEDLNSIYSSTNLQNGTRVKFWSDLGVSFKLAGKRLRALKLPDQAAETLYFKQQVLLNSGFAKDVETVSISQALAILQANTNAIVFANLIEPLPAGLKVVAISESLDKKAYLPNEKNIYAENYPLSRFLNLYFVRSPGEKLEVELGDFFSFILSAEGQSVVREQGLVPLNAAIVERERSKL